MTYLATDATDKLFRFEEEGHRYLLGDQEIPGITSIMQAAGLTDFSMIPKDVLEMAQARGTAVHQACHLYDTGRLDFSTLDPRIYPYLQGWMAFCSDFKFVPTFSETPLINEKKLYAGTPDKHGQIVYSIKQEAVVEIKTGAPGDHAPGVQMAAQEDLLRHNNIITTKKPVLRLAVHLNGDGKYKLEEHKDPNDLGVFMSALSIFNYMKRQRRK